MQLSLFEVVHIQLPDERKHVLLHEVNSNDLGKHAIKILNDDPQTVLAPADDILCSWVADDVVKLFQKC